MAVYSQESKWRTRYTSFTTIDVAEEALTMKVGRFATQLQYSIIALALMSVCLSRALAQGHSHTLTTENQELTANQKMNASALIRIVRESTERFKDVAVAQAEGYALQFGCVSGSDSGAMGLHFVNGDLVSGSGIHANRPQ